MRQLTPEQQLRLDCLMMANNYGCVNELCEHQIQLVAIDYYHFVMSGEASQHEEINTFHNNKMAQA